MKTAIIFIIIYLLFSFFLKKTAKQAEQQRKTRPQEPPLPQKTEDQDYFEQQTLPEPANTSSRESEQAKDKRENILTTILGVELPEPEPAPEPEPMVMKEKAPEPVQMFPAFQAEQKAVHAPKIAKPVISPERSYRRLSPATLREGIILAEILGPCLANRRAETLPYT